MRLHRTRRGICILALFLTGSVVYGSGVTAQTHTRPVRIGVLTSSWGPTPHVVGLRNGLLALGYREEEDFVLGIRFTQGDVAALPSAADEVEEGGVRRYRYVDGGVRRMEESRRGGYRCGSDEPVVVPYPC